MIKLKVIITVFTLIFSLLSLAESDPATGAEPIAAPTATPVVESQSVPVNYSSDSDAFNAGLNFYSEKKYDKAVEAFNAASQLNPNNPLILTNLGMSYFQTGASYWAIATLRKSLNRDPDQLTTQEALKFILSKSNIKEIPHEILFSENIRSAVLEKISLNKIFFITAILLLASGWLLISYVAKRKEALKTEQMTPPQPWVAIILFLFFAGSISLATLKLYDSFLVRATIVEEKISAKSFYGENGATIFDLFGGHEVIVEKTESEWAQVTYPGALTGWVPLKALLITTGK